MFEICSSGEIVALTAKPRYVKRNETSGLFVETTQEEAEAISVNGTLYNVPGGTAIEGAPEATVREADASEYIFNNRVNTAQNTAAEEQNRADIDFIAMETGVELE